MFLLHPMTVTLVFPTKQIAQGVWHSIQMVQKCLFLMGVMMMLLNIHYRPALMFPPLPMIVALVPSLKILHLKA